MTITIWRGNPLDNQYTTDSVAAFSSGNKYYFKNETTGEESKVFTVLFGTKHLGSKRYLAYQIKKFSKRKKKFIEGGVQKMTVLLFLLAFTAVVLVGACVLAMTGSYLLMVLVQILLWHLYWRLMD